MMSDPVLLDVNAVARLLSVSPRFVWRACDAGHLPKPITIGTKLKRWTRESIEQFIANQSPPPATPKE